MSERREGRKEAKRPGPIWTKAAVSNLYRDISDAGLSRTSSTPTSPDKVEAEAKSSDGDDATMLELGTDLLIDRLLVSHTCTLLLLIYMLSVKDCITAGNPIYLGFEVIR